MRLREAGVIPALSVSRSASRPIRGGHRLGESGESQRRLWQPYQGRASSPRSTAILAAIPADDLAIQWDVAVEVGALEGVFTPVDELGSDERIVDELVASARAGAATRAARLPPLLRRLQAPPFQPRPTSSLLVRLANAVAARAPIDFVHMPVDRDNGRSRRPTLPAPRSPPVGTQLALGVIDYENDGGRIDELVAAA